MNRRIRFHDGKEASLFDDACQLGEALATRIVAELQEANRKQRTYLLGCPAGRSGKSTYEALARSFRNEPIDCSSLVIVTMDEYLVEADTGFAYCPIESHYSCRNFANREIRQRLNETLPSAYQIPEKNLWVPDPQDPVQYDRRIEEANGVDLFILASGASDGHVAFNPPGSSLESGTRVVEIAEQTRRDNLATFPDFQSLEEVPRYGVSVGLGTLFSLSKKLVLVIHGADKQQAVKRLAECKGFDVNWPASIALTSSRAQVYLDCPSAASLDSTLLLSPTQEANDARLF